MAGQHSPAAALLLVAIALNLGLVLSKSINQGHVVNHHLRETRRSFNHVAAPLRKEPDLPKNFDWSNKDGKNWLVSNWNQHIPKYCGSCYLHATLSMIQDRLKINKGEHSPDVMLGRQSFLWVNCAPSRGYSNGCNGGDVIDVLTFMADHGLPDEGCMPYSATDSKDWGLHKHDKCPAIAFCTNCMPDAKDPSKDDCWAIRKPVIYKVGAYGNVGATKPDPGNVAAMMSEIYHRGPIVCSISCPEDFVNKYDGGVYNDTSGDTDVDHDVEVVGWGEEDGVPFWKVRNSWGQYWGVNSFFRIVRGINAQQVEAGDCWYAEPTWEVEKAVEEGEMIGSMTGLRKKKKQVGQEEDASHSSLFADFDDSGSLEEQRLAFKKLQAQKHEQAAEKGGAWAAVARRLRAAAEQ